MFASAYIEHTSPVPDPRYFRYFTTASFSCVTRGSVVGSGSVVKAALRVKDRQRPTKFLEHQIDSPLVCPLASLSHHTSMDTTTCELPRTASRVVVRPGVDELECWSWCRRVAVCRGAAIRPSVTLVDYLVKQGDSPRAGRAISHYQYQHPGNKRRGGINARALSTAPD